MIVLCGIPSERPLRRVADALEVLGAPYVLLNQRRFADWELIVDDDGHHGLLRLDTMTIPLHEIAAVYLRPMDHRHLPEYEADRECCEQRHRDLYEWFESSRALVVNRPSLQSSNSSKPYQAQVIARAGLRVPETLITDDPDAVRAFADRSGPLVFKSISGARSIVRRLDREGLDRLERIRACPVQFQQCVEGFDVRVHRAGPELLATAVDSTAVDYRYAHEEGRDADLREYALDPDLTERCLAACDALGLPLAGIDLRITEDGEAYCFEVNPSPAFSFYESQTGQPVAAAIARLLAAGPGADDHAARQRASAGSVTRRAAASDAAARGRTLPGPASWSAASSEDRAP